MNVRREPHQGHRSNVPRHIILPNEGDVCVGPSIISLLAGGGGGTTRTRLTVPMRHRVAAQRPATRTVRGDAHHGIGKTAKVRRTLAGFLFALSYAALCVTVGGWLLQRAAFEPSATRGAARSILKDPQITDEITARIAEATADALGQDPLAVQAVVTTVAHHPDGARYLARFIGDAHAKLIGARSEPVVIEPDELVQIVRHEAVAGLDPVVVPIDEVTALSVVRQVLTWAVPVGAVAFVVLFLAGLTTHPNRAGLLRSLGFALLVLAVAIVLFGYLVPRYLISALAKSPWARIPSILAENAQALTIALVVILVGIGALLISLSAMIRRRRHWARPINTYRYTEQRHWS